MMLKLKLQYFGHLMRRVDSLERLWCWEGLEAGEEGDDRGWDGWMASLTRWTWIWVNSGSWWWAGRPGMLRFMGLQRVEHDWATELNWTEHWTAGLPVSFNPEILWFFRSNLPNAFPPDYLHLSQWWKSVAPGFHNFVITSEFSPSLCQVAVACVQLHQHGFWVSPVSDGPHSGHPPYYYWVLGKLLEIALKATYNLLIIPVKLPWYG